MCRGPDSRTPDMVTLISVRLFRGRPWIWLDFAGNDVPGRKTSGQFLVRTPVRKHAYISGVSGGMSGVPDSDKDLPVIVVVECLYYT